MLTALPNLNPESHFAAVLEAVGLKQFPPITGTVNQDEIDIAMQFVKSDIIPKLRVILINTLRLMNQDSKKLYNRIAIRMTALDEFKEDIDSINRKHVDEWLNLERQLRTAKHSSLLSVIEDSLERFCPGPNTTALLVALERQIKMYLSPLLPLSKPTTNEQGNKKAAKLLTPEDLREFASAEDLAFQVLIHNPSRFAGHKGGRIKQLNGDFPNCSINFARNSQKTSPRTLDINLSCKPNLESLLGHGIMIKFATNSGEIEIKRACEITFKRFELKSSQHAKKIATEFIRMNQ